MGKTNRVDTRSGTQQNKHQRSSRHRRSQQRIDGTLHNQPGGGGVQRRRGPGSDPKLSLLDVRPSHGGVNRFLHCYLGGGV